jgi:hypothetical protein
MIGEHNLRPIKKGDTWVMTLAFYDDECETTPINVSTYVFKLQAKNATGTVIFEWLDNIFVQIDNFTRRVTLSPTTTNGYTAGEFTYELQVGISTNSYTWMQGYVQVDTQITS